MVRSVAKSELSTTEAAARYGFSRQMPYSSGRVVEREGIAGRYLSKNADAAVR